MDSSSSQLPSNIQEFEDYVWLQDTLADISETNYDKSKESLFKSSFLKNLDLMAIFVENILNTLSIRPKSTELLERLVGDVLSFQTTSIDKESFRKLFLKAIFRPIGDWKFVLKIPLFLFLRNCYLKRYISFFDITSEIRDLLANDDHAQNISALICCIFAQELESFDPQLFRNLIIALENRDQGSFFDIFLSPYHPSLAEFRTNNWHAMKELITSTHDDAILANAIKNDDIEFLRQYTIDYRFNPNKQIPELPFEPCLFLQGGPTLIQYAAFFGSIQCFKYLYLLKASLQLKDRRNRPLIMFAIAGGNLEIVRILEQSGVSFRGTLKIAMQFRRFDIFDWIIRTHGDSINDIQYELNAILCMCCRIDNLRGAIECVELGATPGKVTDGMSPLLNAAVNGNYEVIRFIAQCPGVEINGTNFDGKSALHLAVRTGRLDSVKFLVGAGVELNSHARDGATPLHTAAKYGQRNIVNYLIGCKDIDLNAIDLSGATPLHYATIYSQQDVVKTLLMCPGVNVLAQTTNEKKCAFDLARDSQIRRMIAESLSFVRN